MRAARRAVPQVLETREAAPVFDLRYLDPQCPAGGDVLRYRSSSAARLMSCAASPGYQKILNDCVVVAHPTTIHHRHGAI